eukprot:scaffold90284_cov45-Attheya_sp.AAC.1
MSADAFFNMYRSRFQNAMVPEAPTTHVPLANDSSLPDSQKVRYELEYLVDIFKSWKTAYVGFDEVVSLSNLCAMQNTKMENGHTQYEHDGLAYKSFYRMGVNMMKGGKLHYYLQIPLSNNGYLYRIVNPEEIRHSGISLHQGVAHPSGIGGYVALNEIGSLPVSEFVEFASEWFGCDGTLLRLSVFYNGAHNRVDI